MIEIISTIISTIIMVILTYIVKKYSDKKRVERNTVNKLLNLLENSIWYFYPEKDGKEIEVEKKLTFLLENVSNKSARQPVQPCSSYFIHNGLVCNYPNTDYRMYDHGAVKFKIKNQKEILEILKSDSLPKSLNRLEDILKINFNVNIDCCKNSLNALLLELKEIILKYDKNIGKRYSWLKINYKI